MLITTAHYSAALRTRNGFVAVLLVVTLTVLEGAVPVHAQIGAPVLTLPDRVTNIARPRVAVAPDGSFALVYEGFVLHEPLDEWQIVVERFDAAGRTLGPAIYFEPEDVCAGLDLWNEDYQAHAEPAYGPDGTLFVSMTHAGLRDLLDPNGGFVQRAETSLGVVAPDGRVVDLDPDTDRCQQYKPQFSSLSTEYRPRLALTDNDVVLVQEGRFELQGENPPEVPNSALHVVPGGLDAARALPTQPPIAQAIVHDDPLSRVATHEAPDVAATGSRLAVAWQECPYEFVVENSDVVTRHHECFIRARFATVAGRTVEPDGDAVRVSSAPAGTVAITPSVAMDAAGRSVVVWADTRTGMQGDVFVQRFDADGRALGGNVQVSASDGQLYTRPEVAVRPDGAFAVVWTDSTSAGLQALVRRYDATGSPLGGPTILGPTAPETGLPHVAATDDDYLFAWLSRTEAGGTVRLHAAHEGQPVEAEGSLLPTGMEASVYPNPAATTARLVYSLPHAAPVEVTTYDLLGREMAPTTRSVQAAGRHEERLDVRGLPPGLYLVRLATPDARITRHLVVAR